MLIGDGIRLRAAERSDIPNFVRWLNDPDVYHNLQLRSPLSLADEERWFEGMLTRPPREQVLVIEIETPQGWRPVGNTSLMAFDLVSANAEVGIFIGEKDLWGRGIAQNALRLVLNYAFNDLNLERVGLRVYAPNHHAIRCYEAVGFVHEGRQRKAMYRKGELVDILLMSVLRSEWTAQAQKP